MMRITTHNRVRALLFGLSEDLAGELSKPLSKFCTHIDEIRHQFAAVANCGAQVLFCGANTEVVSRLRETNPEASIVVVSRHPEVSGWLDSIEAGATDYCAAPFETAQVQWILESSMRAVQVPVSA
jgi:ActR/RegA family two-component response regulator